MIDSYYIYVSITFTVVITFMGDTTASRFGSFKLT